MNESINNSSMPPRRASAVAGGSDGNKRRGKQRRRKQSLSDLESFLQQAPAKAAAAPVRERCGKWCGGHTKLQAVLCSSCGWGTKQDHCVACGRHAFNATRSPASLCSGCGFGLQRCVKCDGHVGTGSKPAVLCLDCGFGSASQNCAKMKLVQ